MKFFSVVHGLAGTSITIKAAFGDSQQEAEQRRIWSLYVKGYLEIYFDTASFSAVLVWEAEDSTQVETWFRQLPVLSSHLFQHVAIAAGPWFPARMIFDTPARKKNQGAQTCASSPQSSGMTE